MINKNVRLLYYLLQFLSETDIHVPDNIYAGLQISEGTLHLLYVFLNQNICFGLKQFF